MSIQIQARTLQIQPSGARLSPDLAELLGNQYKWDIDREKKTLKIIILQRGNGHVGRVAKVWSGNEKARSKLIALRSAIMQMGLDYDALMGKVYDVKVRGKTLEVQF